MPTDPKFNYHNRYSKYLVAAKRCICPGVYCLLLRSLKGYWKYFDKKLLSQASICEIRTRAVGRTYYTRLTLVPNTFWITILFTLAALRPSIFKSLCGLSTNNNILRYASVGPKIC